MYGKHRDEDELEDVNMDEIASIRRWLMDQARYNPATAWMVASLDGLNRDDPFWEYDEDLSDVDQDGPF